MVINNPYPAVVIPDTTLSDYLLKGLDKYGDNLALIDAADERNNLTFRQVKDLSINCAKAFASLELGRGDFIATCFSSCVHFPIIAIGTSICGASLTTCNPNFTEGETKHLLQDSRPKVVIIDGKNYEKVKRVSKDVKSIKHIFSIDDASGCMSFKELLKVTAHKDYPRNVVVKPDDIFFLPYSSGTTGLPKGVMITQRNMLASCQAIIVALPLSQRTVYYGILPMFHIFGCMVCISSLLQGAKLVIEKRFEIETFFRNVQKYKINAFAAVPPVLLAIYNSPLRSKYDLSSLKEIACAAAPLPEYIGLQVQKALQLRIVQGWGLTEGVFASASRDPLIPLKSVGLPFPNTELKIVDVQSGKELEQNQAGEICGRGPSVMKGYYNNPSATAQCIDKDGWFHTGDIGYYDNYGNLYIVDRLKELIKYKGFQVAPAELEEVVLSHPKVADAAVIGVPDSFAGEIPKAVVVRKDNSVTAEDIQQFVKGKVATYKQLRGGVVFRDSIPKNPSGKILRRELRAMERKAKL